MQPKGLTVKVTLPLLAAALIFTASAAAAGPSIPWTVKDIKTAIRAIGYPKPRPVKLVCTGQGSADSSSRFASLRCTATYRHHARKRFVIAGRGEGGWLCAGKTLAGCVVLSRGFVTTAQTAGDMEGTASLAAFGYLQNHYGVNYATRSGLCRQSGTSWSCDYNWTNNSILTVTVTFKMAKGGYTTAATATSQ